MEAGPQGTKDRGAHRSLWLTEAFLLSPVIQPSGEEVNGLLTVLGSACHRCCIRKTPQLEDSGLSQAKK